MERDGTPLPEVPRCCHIAGFLPRREPAFGSVLTETVLSELKKQAPDGCVLGSLDTWGDEEWD
jgi:hypothetical protein